MRFPFSCSSRMIFTGRSSSSPAGAEPSLRSCAAIFMLLPCVTKKNSVLTFGALVCSSSLMTRRRGRSVSTSWRRFDGGRRKDGNVPFEGLARIGVESTTRSCGKRRGVLEKLAQTVCEAHGSYHRLLSVVATPNPHFASFGCRIRGERGLRGLRGYTPE